MGDMASQPMAAMAMVDTMARGLLMLSPRPRLMPGTDMVAFMDTAFQLMADMAMAVTMARGLLMPNPRLGLKPGTDMVAFTDTAFQLMADMAMVDTMARGLLMLSPRLRLCLVRIWWPLWIRPPSLWRIRLWRILWQEVNSPAAIPTVTSKYTPKNIQALSRDLFRKIIYF